MRNRVDRRRGATRTQRGVQGGAVIFGGTEIHDASIGRIVIRSHARADRSGRARTLHPLIVLAAALISPLGHGATPSARPDGACSAQLRAERPIFEQRLELTGTTPAAATVTGTAAREWLIEVGEQGDDAVLEVRDSDDRPLARADHPERRTGTHRAIVAARDAALLRLQVTGKEHAGLKGTAEVRVVDFAALAARPDCVRAYRALAAADADYASGQDISLGKLKTAAGSARHAYLRAAEEYRAAFGALEDPGDRQLRGEAALALAGVEYFDLQDWEQSAEWAAAAEPLLAPGDAYRAARARALAAAAWIETAAKSDADPAASSAGAASHELFARTRRVLRELAVFHVRRHERYDAALQLNNVGLAYFYEGGYTECAAEFLVASKMFDAVGEVPRQALAWQNRAMCLWGLGHLPEALPAFNQALAHLGPEPYPQLYMLTLNNAALVNYALGHFDESLRLHDRALGFATQLQNRREQAQSLYGIGVTYYALGNRLLAREFLERSLAIRTEAIDSRGHMAALRALATIHGEAGERQRAIELGREALALATAPSARARISIQIAVQTAASGQRPAALALLAAVLDPKNPIDPLLHAQALVQRAGIERATAAYDAALRDAEAAIPVTQRLRSPVDEFAAELEQARVLRALGRRAAALAAVDRALRLSEAIRTQTANPELRAQLQAPLRPAYDLKLDLLWDESEEAARRQLAGRVEAIATAAFRSADAARARSFGDLAAAEYSAETRHALAPEFARRERLYGQLAARRFALDARLDLSGSGDPRAAALEGELAGLERELDTVNNAIAARAATHAASADGARPPTDRARLPADDAILAYWIGADAAYAWAVTGAGIHWVRLGAPATITASARAFHAALSHLVDVSADARLAAGAVLYRDVIRPVEPWVTHYRRWFVVPDAALDYVPFTAMRAEAPAGAAFVAATHDVALTPAAWMLLARRSAAASRAHAARILLVSDPVYEPTDPRLAPARAAAGAPAAGEVGGALPLTGAAYRRLPGTAHEAAAVAAEFPPGEVDALAGLDASRENLLGRDWARYRLIHIASHGVVDARMPQLSALVLSTYDRDGRPVEGAVRAADLALLTLNADVAVFSGCETALGKDVASEGMAGVAYATLARGADAVVASLWAVPDEIATRLMTEFYRHLIRHAMNPTAALGAAMRSELVGHPAADPALWAPFQVSVTSLVERSSPALRTAAPVIDNNHQ